MLSTSLETFCYTSNALWALLELRDTQNSVFLWWKRQALPLTLLWVDCRGHFSTKIKGFLKKIDPCEILLWNVFFQLKRISNKVRGKITGGSRRVIIFRRKKIFERKTFNSVVGVFSFSRFCPTRRIVCRVVSVLHISCVGCHCGWEYRGSWFKPRCRS